MLTFIVGKGSNQCPFKPGHPIGAKGNKIYIVHLTWFAIISEQWNDTKLLKACKNMTKKII